MSLTSESMTPADIAAVTGNNGNGMWGDGGAWWIIILFLFVFCGWGNGNGWGNNGGAGAADNYVLASDFATLQRQIDSSTASLERKSDAINSGLCDGFYAQNTTALNGFSNVNQNLCNGFAQAELSRANGQMNLMQQMNANNITAMQNANALQSQLAQCCCDNREAIAGINYNMAMNTNALQHSVESGFCQTNYNNASNTRDIIDNQNSNARAILDALNAQQLAAKDAKIAEQNQQIFGLQLAASQQAQNNYLVQTLKPAPVPSFPASQLYGYMGGCCNPCNTCS
jgi:hypothetical protein|nr:MAG TPA: hypothetical protein [Caudoviricetes sp.]